MNAPHHDPWAAARSANYRLFAAASLASGLGMQMSGMALGWEVYERTRSAWVLGFLGVARALPVVLCAIPAGQVIDSLRRHRVLTATFGAFALVFAALALVSRAELPVWMILALVGASGLVRTFNGPSRASLLPDLVPPAVFPNAVTWNSGLFQASAISGPLLAGLIIAQTGGAWVVYAVTAGLFCVAAALSLRLRPLREEVAGGLSLRGLWSGMGAGVSHVYREKLILSTITLDLFGVLLGGVTALLPIYAEEILGVGPLGLGFLRAAPFIGALLMTLVLAVRPIRRGAGKLLLGSVAGYGACIVGFAFSELFWQSMLLLIASGAADTVSVVIRHVLVQTRTPPGLRGRVSAVNSMFIESSNELGAFQSGAVAGLLTGVLGKAGAAFASAALGGVGTLLVVVAVALRWPEVRRLDRLMEEPEAKEADETQGAKATPG